MEEEKLSFGDVLAKVPVMDDDWLDNDEYLLPRDDESIGETPDLDETFDHVEFMVQANEEVQGERRLTHPVLLSMDDPVSFDKKLTMSQNTPVASPVIVGAHNMLQEMKDLANDKIASGLLQLEAHAKGSRIFEVIARRLAGEAVEDEPNDDQLAQEAAKVRIIIENVMGDAIDEALEKGSIHPSRNQWKSLKPWMIEIMQSHYHTFGIPNEREKALLIRLLRLPDDKELNQWFKEKHAAMLIRGLTLKQKLAIKMLYRRSALRALKPFQHH